MRHGFEQHPHRENILLPVKPFQGIEKAIRDILGMADDQEYGE
jgi:hypothetical protein